MTVFTSPLQSADWLKAEAGSSYSRDIVTIASGAGKLVSGTVLAEVTATGKYVPAAATGTDGSETAVAILFAPVDATSADQQAVVIARQAIVSHLGLTFGPTITNATMRAAANAQLKAVGILVREGA